MQKLLTILVELYISGEKMDTLVIESGQLLIHVEKSEIISLPYLMHKNNL